jgi:hypothetical protein
MEIGQLLKTKFFLININKKAQSGKLYLRAFPLSKFDITKISKHDKK